MRKIISILAFGLTIYFSFANSATSNASVESERALREECSYEITGVRECLEKKQKASQANLTRAEEQVRGVLSKWDEDEKYVNLAKARLTASGKAFTKYREAQCAFAASLGGGAIGNALEMGRLACMAELNNRRAEQLRDVVSDMPLK
jgi:uncharacterized protein YecT (DUF1311 family)